MLPPSLPKVVYCAALYTFTSNAAHWRSFLCAHAMMTIIKCVLPRHQPYGLIQEMDTRQCYLPVPACPPQTSNCRYGTIATITFFTTHQPLCIFVVSPRTGPSTLSLLGILHEKRGNQRTKAMGRLALALRARPPGEPAGQRRQLQP